MSGGAGYGYPTGVRAVIRLVAVVLLGLALFTLPAAAQNGSTVVAGESAGGVRLGALINDVLTVLGPVNDKADREKYSVYDWPLKPFLVIAEKESGKVVLVLIQLSDTFKTNKGGLTGGSDREMVEATYGKEYSTNEDQRTITLIYDAQGIAFDIGKNGVMMGRVMSIIVFVPGQWKSITENL